MAAGRHLSKAPLAASRVWLALLREPAPHPCSLALHHRPLPLLALNSKGCKHNSLRRRARSRTGGSGRRAPRTPRACAGRAPRGVPR